MAFFVCRANYKVWVLPAAHQGVQPFTLQSDENFFICSAAMGLTFSVLAAVLIATSFWLYAVNRVSASMWLLVVAGIVLRLAVSSLDPFLHLWDERYHALVARNMMRNAFVPKLCVNPVLPFDYAAWCCNEIWLHKPPLFLWQMALSMKIFGVNELTMRLPSAVMGGMAVWFLFRLVFIWTNSRRTSYWAAAFAALSHYGIELNSGYFGLDHNDSAFAFYVTASLWAFSEYTRRRLIGWALAVGFFAGCAVLNKWLPGLLVYSGWFVWLWMENSTPRVIKFRDTVLSLVVCAVVFIPWQLYIFKTFPKEASAEYGGMHEHFFSVLDNQGGPWWQHLARVDLLYGAAVWIFLVPGIWYSFRHKRYNQLLSVVCAVWVFVMYVFFSVAATKMTAFTFPVYGVMFGFIAIGVHVIGSWFSNRSPTKALFANHVLFVLLAIYILQPWSFKRKHGNSEERLNRIHNTVIFKSIPDSIAQRYIVFNTRNGDNIALMFYKGGTAYDDFPNKQTIDSLIASGHRIAAFRFNNDIALPDYAKENVLLLDYELR